MKVKVNIQQQGIQLNEDFEGSDADELVSKMKARVSKELPFALRLAVNAMSSLGFAQEVVRRFNQTEKTAYPQPVSCDAFLELAQSLGFVHVIIP